MANNLEAVRKPALLYENNKGLARPATLIFSAQIEDIYFFEVNTKYISSSVLKISEFS